MRPRPKAVVSGYSNFPCFPPFPVLPPSPPPWGGREGGGAGAAARLPSLRGPSLSDGQNLAARRPWRCQNARVRPQWSRAASWPIKSANSPRDHSCWGRWLLHALMGARVPSSGGQGELKAPDPQDVENLTIGTNF